MKPLILRPERTWSPFRLTPHKADLEFIAAFSAKSCHFHETNLIGQQSIRSSVGFNILTLPISSIQFLVSSVAAMWHHTDDLCDQELQLNI